MPNFDTSSALVDSAAKCLAIAASGAPDFRNQRRAVWALVSVSCVVKVFDAIRNRLVSGSIRFSVSAMCVPSTLETKCSVMRGCW